MHGFGWDGTHMLWGGWWMLLFWIGVGVLMIWGLRGLVTGSRPESNSHHTPTAREIAERRYARGEISREEFLALVNDLEGHNSPPQKAKRSEH